MAVLRDEEKTELEKAFAAFAGPTGLIMFTQERECEHCQVTRDLVEELARLSPKLSLEVHDFVADEGRAKELGVDKIPAVLVTGAGNHRVRFYGVPAGYTFSTLIEAIVDVSRADHGLPAGVAAELAGVDRPVHLQVLTSPT